MKRLNFLEKKDKKNLVVALCITILGVVIGVINYSLFPILGFMRFDFTTSVIPGWHTTVYPHLIIIQQIVFALICLQLIVISILILLKNTTIFNLKILEFINIGLLIFCSFVAINHVFELFISIKSGYIYEQFAFYNRVMGSGFWLYFFILLMNIILPQMFWFKKIRSSLWMTLFISLCLSVVGFFENMAISWLF